jgi:hypothetical protein
MDNLDLTSVKRCRRCKETKSIQDFYEKISSVDGLTSHCKECEKQHSLNWHKENPDRRRVASRKYYYGITENEWDAQLVVQNNRCGICNSDNPMSSKGWQTDHDHSTNKFRGILCYLCNPKLDWYIKNQEQIQKYLLQK